MVDYRLRRGKMVEELCAQGVGDERVLVAMNKVPRHLFVEEALRDVAYHACALPLAGGQSISHPLTVARMTESLQLKGTERVLEIGTGSGYQTAILAELSERVFSIERLRDLVVQARRCLDSLRYYNVLVKLGDGSAGWPDRAPFDVIVVTAGVGAVPKQLEEQLAEGGRMIVPVGDAREQEVLLQQKINGRLCKKKRFPCKFVELVGDYGWSTAD